MYDSDRGQVVTQHGFLREPIRGVGSTCVKVCETTWSLAKSALAGGYSYSAFHVHSLLPSASALAQSKN